MDEILVCIDTSYMGNRFIILVQYMKCFHCHMIVKDPYEFGTEYFLNADIVHTN